MIAENTNEYLKILRNRYDDANKLVIQFAMQNDLEHFQWTRGYAFAISQIIYELEKMEVMK